MDVTKGSDDTKQDKKNEEDEAIDRALAQMEMIYKSRCVQPPRGANVTVREIEKDQ